MTQASQANGAPSPLRLTVTGRVELVTKKQTAGGDLFLTLVKSPSADPYSAPGVFEVKSRARLGGIGSEVAQLCEVRGYSRSYKNADGETVRTAEHVLQAVQ